MSNACIIKWWLIALHSPFYNDADHIITKAHIYLAFYLHFMTICFRGINIYDHAFNQRQKYEAERNQQIPVQCLWIADFRQVTIQRTKKEHDGQNCCDPQCHSVTNVILFHPEYNPAEHHNEHCGKVHLDEVVSNSPLERKGDCNRWEISLKKWIQKRSNYSLIIWCSIRLLIPFIRNNTISSFFHFVHLISLMGSTN